MRNGRRRRKEGRLRKIETSGGKTENFDVEGKINENFIGGENN